MATSLDTPWERLRWARQIAGVSARELDRLAGLSEGHTALLEAGKKGGLEMRTATRLVEVLGLSLDWLVRAQGSVPSEEDIRAAVKRAQTPTAVAS